MADPQIYRQAFSDNVAELIGLPTAPVLMKMFSQETKHGDSVRIDGLKANDATVTATQSLPSRRDVTTPDFAEWYSIQTPYTGSTKQGSYVSCKTIEAADNNDYTVIDELYCLLKKPYDEQIDQEKWFAKRPEWARTKVGCSMLSCSS